MTRRKIAKGKKNRHILREKLRSKSLWTLIFTENYATYGLDLLAPVYAILVLDRIPKADISTVGLATALALLSMGIFRIPIARYMDHKKGLMDEYIFLLISLPLLAMVPVLYIWVDQIWQIYLLQIFTGLFQAMNFPAWSTLVIKKMNKNKTAMQWSLAMVIGSFKTASAAFLGALIVRYWGFDALLAVSPLIALPGIILIIKNREFIVDKKAV